MSSDPLLDILGSPALRQEIAFTFIGEKIGSGLHRTVFACRIDPSLVVKVEVGSCSFANVREWELWDEVHSTKDVARWLAPCVAISPCGSVLLQRRAEKCDKGRYPEKVPAWFGDMKFDNFGMLDGKLVCVDYAGIPVSHALFQKRMKKADWWHDTDYHGKEV